MNDELYKPFKYCFTILKTFGMWRDGSQPFKYAFGGILLYFITVGSFLTCFLGAVILAEDLTDFTGAFGLVITCLVLIFKSLNFCVKFKSIMKLEDSLNLLLEFSRSDQMIDDRELLRSPLRFGFKVSKVFWLSGFLGTTAGMVPSVLSHQMPLKTWFPFDTKTSEIGFYAGAIFDLINTPMVFTFDCALSILPVTFIMFAIGLTDELCGHLEQIGKQIQTKRSGKVDEENLVKLIKTHLKIRKFVEDIQENFYIAIFVQGLMSSLILCFSAFCMSVVSLIYSKETFLIVSFVLTGIRFLGIHSRFYFFNS